MWRILGIVLAIVLAIPARMVVQAHLFPPDNTFVSGWNTWTPDPGYTWIDPDHKRKGVRWVPASPHPAQPNVIASQEQARWLPAPGYAWVSTDPADMKVRWVPGLEFPGRPHVIASEDEKQWLPSPGYDWSTQTTLAVLWVPGRRHPKYSHITSAAVEGEWQVDPGYVFGKKGDISSAVWRPNNAHPSIPHLYASYEEGRWIPAAGYALQTNGNGEIIGVVASVDDSGNSRVGRVVLMVLGAIIAHRVSQPQDDDGYIRSNIVRPLAKELRNAAIGEVAKELEQ